MSVSFFAPKFRLIVEVSVFRGWRERLAILLEVPSPTSKDQNHQYYSHQEGGISRRAIRNQTHDDVRNSPKERLSKACIKLLHQAISDNRSVIAAHLQRNRHRLRLTVHWRALWRRPVWVFSQKERPHLAWRWRRGRFSLEFARGPSDIQDGNLGCDRFVCHA